MDDVFVLSLTNEVHIRNLACALQLLGDVGLPMKLKKCHFFKGRVDYLGHVILPGNPAGATENSKSIQEATFPTDIMRLRSFLGACNMYRRFVEGYVTIAKSLTEMTRKKHDPDWLNSTEEHLGAF